MWIGLQKSLTENVSSTIEAGGCAVATVYNFNLSRHFDLPDIGSGGAAYPLSTAGRGRQVGSRFLSGRSEPMRGAVSDASSHRFA